MRKQFQKDILVEIAVDGNSVEVTAAVTFTTTPYDPGVACGPPEQCYPPEGGEIEDAEVTALTAEGGVMLECPKWLGEVIIESTSEETLNEAVDWDDSPDDRGDGARPRRVRS